MRVRRLILLTVLSLATLGCGGGGGDSGGNTQTPLPTPGGTISGLVIDLEGRPIKDAQVELAGSTTRNDTFNIPPQPFSPFTKYNFVGQGQFKIIQSTQVFIDFKFLGKTVCPEE